MKTAYLDCVGGVSGNMLLGALVDAGLDVEELTSGLASLDLPGWRLQTQRVRKQGIAATYAEVLVGDVDAADAPLLRLPSTDAPLAARDGGYRHEHTHGEAVHHHDHGRSHSHLHCPGATGASDLAAVLAVIRRSALPGRVGEQAEAVYRRLAEAEAAVHGVDVDTVHFHEVGAVDSIVDIVGCVLGLHLLGVEDVRCSPLPNGRGFVRCAHGSMPIPPPATAELLRGVPIRPADVEGEMVTPTGAALARTLSSGFGDPPAGVIERVGYGAGKRDFPIPNLLRVLLMETQPAAPPEGDTVVVLEANLDDLSPQLYDGVMRALFAAGALDVWITPVQMKKNRPGCLLSALAPPELRDRLAGVLFAETTTLGLRYSTWNRSCLEREWVEAETGFGSVRLKVARRNGRIVTATPEFEDCRARAEQRGVPIRQVQAAAQAAAWRWLAEQK